MSEREPVRHDSQLVPTSAVLDEAHLGDIHGAFGTIRLSDVAPRRTWRRRLLTLAAIIGPGLIVMVGDNDAGGVSTYAQAGQDFGYSLLWTLIILIPVLIVNQEMVVRLGAVTGVGHARLIKERFGRFWGWFSVGDLFVLNFLTISTEFIGVSLAGQYFGFSPYVVVPLAAVILIAITITGNFRRWERAMFVFLFASLLVLPLLVLSHPDPTAALVGFIKPGVQGGLTSDAALLIIAIVGTTVAPWQLFFQQSNVIDKRITPRWLDYEKADTVLGAFVVVVGAAAIMMASASAFTGTSDFGRFTDALHIARGLASHISPIDGTIFALLLFDASIVGASAVTLATSYAFGDIFGLRHSLHRGIREAKLFYGSYTVMVALAAGIVLIPRAPLGLITTAVQALAGTLLPSATVFLVLLCNDRAVLGPWVNRLWLNVLATIIVSVLIMLSLILVISTVAPGINVTNLLALLSVVTAAVVVVATGLMVWRARKAEPTPGMPRAEKENWRMPALALLERPAWSLPKRVAMLTMATYIVIAVLFLAIKAVQIALLHH
ncbi:MAG: manganese transporter [Actinobacteria bacterium 13_1_20CM_2_65_11]|nr:MAG: manganese transporter [Chloroflexi bacterium 13_1_40CM_65_17]OLC64040.1 MAG: manganese transporter [Actinobacteria bacterium 13_1_40CM_4_65_12]OLD25087.1 MAG: manganese transporter [Chloroflexi bacterium 13_1_40CM_3_65_12]OLD49704.1 MAG: manganese transporter [Actinobacteria bacterium 13_1_40CM_2_65_8]OLE81374.1 MAG: manganese transporter [Actinobacteria bacterium 13_1_20CM_2_65_11]